MFVRWRRRKNDGGVTLDALLVESKRVKGGQPKLRHIAYLGTVPESGLEREAAILWWTDVIRRVDKLPKRVDRGRVTALLERKMERPEPTVRDRAIARHEAGHAIARIAMGHKVEKVTIVPVPGKSLGHCIPGKRRVRPVRGWISDREEGWRVRTDVELDRQFERAEIRDAAVFAAAGGVAEKFWDPQYIGQWQAPNLGILASNPGCREDTDNLFDAVKALYPGATPSREVAVIHAVIARSARLLRSHWYEVERLTEALLIYRTLSDAEVRKVIRRPRSA